MQLQEKRLGNWPKNKSTLRWRHWLQSLHFVFGCHVSPIEKCILFVDNEGAKFSLLRGLSDNLVFDFFGEQFVELEASMHAFTWLASAIQLQRGRCTVQG